MKSEIVSRLVEMKHAHHFRLTKQTPVILAVSGFPPNVVVQEIFKVGNEFWRKLITVQIVQNPKGSLILAPITVNLRRVVCPSMDLRALLCWEKVEADSLSSPIAKNL